MKKTIFALIGTAALWMSPATRAQNKYDMWDENYNVQALLGAVQFENLKFDLPDSATPAEVDLSLLPQLGGAWTTTPKGDRFQVGLETTFLLGFQVDEVRYLSAGGSGLYVNVSTSMWMFDLSGGAYANLYLDAGHKVRLYLAGGPLMMYADYRTDKQLSDGLENEVAHESAFGIGAYARTGVEFRVHEYGMLGLGGRATWSNVDFSEVGGSTELVGVSAFVTYTAGF